MSAGFTQQFLSQPSGDLTVTFPYSLTSYRDVTTQKIFSGGGQRLFASPIRNFAFDFNFGIKAHHIIIGLGTGNYRGGSINIGYGFSLNRSRPLWNVIVFKAEVRVGTFIHITEKLGEISSKGYVTNALGKRVDSLIRTRSHYSSASAVSDHVNVYFSEGGIFFLPKFAVEIHPFKNRFFIEASAGWVEQVSQRSGIQMAGQNGHYSDGRTQRVALDYPGLQTAFNGVKISKTPYDLNGIQWGIKIGMSLDDITRPRTRL